MALLPGQVLVNRYRIVKLVGQGGFGAVYRAWDLALHVPVAVKENLDASPEAQHQFEREALVLAPLRHTNLPRVSDHFFIPSQGQYLVMDFVEGKNLEELLAERGHALNEAEVLPWIGQVCEALDYLHRQTPPIIHRDIKPQNIIVTAAGRAMLVDFGISKIYDSSQATTHAARAVTIGYSPPEQYGMGKTNARSDVYALGATLYTLLTGATPPESIGLLSGVETLTPVRQANPGVSPTIERAIAQAMVLPASQRLTGVGAFREALLGQEATPVPPTVVVTNPPVKKRGGASLLFGLAAVAVLAVAIVIAAIVLRGGGNQVSQESPATSPTPTVVVTATAGATEAVTGKVVPLTKTPPPPTEEPTPAPSPTLTATTAPREVAATTVTPTPGAISCPGAFPTRLAVGDTARVATFQINVREGPGAAYSIVRRLDGNRTMEILDGPVCDDGQLWYYIRSETIRPRDGSEPYQAEGWVAEESDDEYLLEPTD